MSSSIALGINAIVLMNKGYTAKDTGKQLGKTPNTIVTLVSKAKKYHGVVT